MKNTKNLGLPIYDNPKSDLFKISDVNSAHTIIDETYETMKNAKDHIVEIDKNIPIKNADAEIVDARRGKSTLGEKVREIDSSLENKMNKGESLSVKQIDKNLGLIDESYLSESLIQQIAGNTPVGSIPPNNSITQNKVVFGTDKQTALYFNGDIIINGIDNSNDLKVTFENGNALHFKYKGGNSSVVLSQKEYVIPHNNALVYNHTKPTDLTIKNSDNITNHDVVVIANHLGKPKEVSCYIPNLNNAISEFIYYTGMMYYKQASTSNSNGVKDIEVNFSSGGTQSLCLKSTNGKVYKNIKLSTLKYTVPHNSALVWKIGDSDSLIVKNVDSITYGDYVIVGNYGGIPKIINLKQHDIVQGAYDCGIYYARNIVTQQLADNSLKVNFLGNDLRLFLKSANGSESISFSKTEWIIPHNNVLVWNKIDKTILIKDYDNINSADIILISNHGGYAKTNNLKDESETVTKGYQTSGSERVKIIDTVITVQSLTQVKEELWVFGGSPDDHSNAVGMIRIYDKNTFTMKKELYHNFGHCNSVDYNPFTDTLIIGNNCALGTEIKPMLYLFYNASAWSSYENGATIDFNTVNKTIINLFKDSNELGNFGTLARPNACWGEQNNGKHNIVYLAMNDNSNFYKLILGKGENDLSSKGYGEFTVTTSDKFNGTCKVLNSFLNPHNYGVNQGICYYKGNIIVGTSHDKLMANSYKLITSPNFELAIENFSNVINLYGDNGSYIAVEPEGVCIIDGMYLCQGYIGNDGRGIVISPLGETQGGLGLTDEKVNFVFEGNSIPFVQITPTSAIVDLYIDSIDRTGFIVKSKSGLSGTFMWKSNIS